MRSKDRQGSRRSPWSYLPQLWVSTPKQAVQLGGLTKPWIIVTVDSWEAKSKGLWGPSSSGAEVG